MTRTLSEISGAGLEGRNGDRCCLHPLSTLALYICKTYGMHANELHMLNVLPIVVAALSTKG